MMNTLVRRVANVWPLASLMWTISKEPGCFSRLITVPTRPKLRPPVIMHKLPDSNLMVSVILPVAMSSWTVSLILIKGSGKRMVRPSCVIKYGTFLGPTHVFLTLHNLYWKVKERNVIKSVWRGFNKELSASQMLSTFHGKRKGQWPSDTFYFRPCIDPYNVEFHCSELRQA